MFICTLCCWKLLTLTIFSVDTTELDTCVQEMVNLRLWNQLLVQELSCLQEENRKKLEEAEAAKFGVGYLRRGNSTQRTVFYTGLPNLAMFDWLVGYVKDSLPHFKSVYLVS